MSEKEKVKNTVERLMTELLESNFSIESLRKFQSLINFVGQKKYEGYIAENDEKDYYNQINQILKSKILELNPNFTEKTLKEMLSGIYRSMQMIVKDVIVVRDAVFFREIQLDDFGKFYKKNIFMLEGLKEEDYKNVGKFNFTFVEFPKPWQRPRFKTELSKEKNIEIHNYIVDNLNKLGFDIYNTNPIKADISKNSSNEYYTDGNCIYQTPLKYYISHGYNQICSAFCDSLDLNIFLIINDNKSEFIWTYMINQTNYNGELKWCIKEYPIEPWILSKELEKQEKCKKLIK